PRPADTQSSPEQVRGAACGYTRSMSPVAGVGATGSLSMVGVAGPQLPRRGGSRRLCDHGRLKTGRGVRSAEGTVPVGMVLIGRRLSADELRAVLEDPARVDDLLYLGVSGS